MGSPHKLHILKNSQAIRPSSHTVLCVFAVVASVHRVEVEAGSQWAALPSVMTWNSQTIALVPLTPAGVTTNASEAPTSGASNASEAPTSSTFNIFGGFLGGAAGSGKSPVDGRSGSDKRQDEVVSRAGSLDMTRLLQYTPGLPPSMGHLDSQRISGLLGSITVFTLSCLLNLNVIPSEIIFWAQSWCFLDVFCWFTSKMSGLIGCIMVFALCFVVSVDVCVCVDGVSLAIHISIYVHIYVWYMIMFTCIHMCV